MPFSSFHAEDLRAWLNQPSHSHAAWKSILRRLGQLCQRPDIEGWGKLDADASAGELHQWVELYKQSPLYPVVEIALRKREQEDAERERAQQEENLRRTKEEAERSARNRIKEEERVALEKIQKAEREKEERRKRGIGALIIGSIAAIPIFFVVYIVVGALAFAGILLLQWLHLEPGGGITRMADLLAAGMSAYYGVAAARSSIGAILNAWNGWPTFVLLIAAWATAFYVLTTRTDLAMTWWLLVVGILHALIAIVTSFFLVARKHDAA
jgi:hypothetical protein